MGDPLTLPSPCAPPARCPRAHEPRPQNATARSARRRACHRDGVLGHPQSAITGRILRMVSLAELIEVAGPGAVELDIFGTTDATDIASKLSSLVVAAAASEVRDGLWCKSSVASVAAVRLEDDRHVVVHAYRPDVTSDFIDGVVRVQSHLADSGFPTARPLSGPVSADGLLGRVECLRPDPGPRRSRRTRCRNPLTAWHDSSPWPLRSIQRDSTSTRCRYRRHGSTPSRTRRCSTSQRPPRVRDGSTTSPQLPASRWATERPVIAHGDWSARKHSPRQRRTGVRLRLGEPPTRSGTDRRRHRRRHMAICRRTRRTPRSHSNRDPTLRRCLRVPSWTALPGR